MIMMIVILIVTKIVNLGMVHFLEQAREINAAIATIETRILTLKTLRNIGSPSRE
jgi:hypothetical protein